MPKYNLNNASQLKAALAMAIVSAFASMMLNGCDKGADAKPEAKPEETKTTCKKNVLGGTDIHFPDGNVAYNAESEDVLTYCPPEYRP